MAYTAKDLFGSDLEDGFSDDEGQFTSNGKEIFKQFSEQSCKLPANAKVDSSADAYRLKRGKTLVSSLTDSLTDLALS